MELNIDEALRYLGAANAPAQLRAQVEQAAGTLTALCRPRWHYRLFDLEKTADGVVLPQAGLTLPGRTAAVMLEDCSQAVLLACTLGTRCDDLLRTEQARDMARAVILDACASAWAEAGCDEAENELAARFPGKYRTDRFSPGYGDLPLSVQRALCAALDTPRRLGLYVTDSLLLNPAKSVTAVIGLADTPQRRRIRGCAYCSMNRTCTLRKEGATCAL